MKLQQIQSLTVLNVISSSTHAVSSRASHLLVSTRNRIWNNAIRTLSFSSRSSSASSSNARVPFLHIQIALIRGKIVDIIVSSWPWRGWSVSVVFGTHNTYLPGHGPRPFPLLHYQCMKGRAPGDFDNGGKVRGEVKLLAHIYSNRLTFEFLCVPPPR